jgi:hypothetical protein
LGVLGRIPPGLRTPLLVLLLLLLHAFLPGPVEAVRLLLLRWVSAPLRLVAGTDASELSPLPESVVERRDAFLQAVRAPFAEHGDALFPLLDLDMEKGWLLVGGGADSGLTPGLRVGGPDGCLGVVDRVTANLSRVRLLTARGVELPVEVRVEDPGRLPAALDRLVGVVTGTGGDAVITQAHLPQLFEVGDHLETLTEKTGDRRWAVGDIVATGTRPRVRLSARPDGAAWVFVEGSQARGVDAASLFDVVPFDLILVGAGRPEGALLAGHDTDDVIPGCAVHIGGRYLGRVVRVAFGVAQVVGPDDAGRRLEVQILSEHESASATLVGEGRGRLRVAGSRGSVQDGPILVLTAGGQELVPPGLLVGEGELLDGVVTLTRRGEWTSRVHVSVFRFGKERRRLLTEQ